MSLSLFFDNLFKQRAQSRLTEYLGPNRCSQPFSPTEVKSGQHYIRITLTKMFLKNSREFLRDYQPAVHSLVRVTLGNQPQEIPHVADAAKIALKEVGGAGVSAQNYSLTPPLPFNGGEISLEAGLLSVQTGN